jgi:hypothetical protein
MAHEAAAAVLHEPAAVVVLRSERYVEGGPRHDDHGRAEPKNHGGVDFGFRLGSPVLQLGPSPGLEQI